MALARVKLARDIGGLLKSAGVKAELRRRADAAADAARAAAPVVSGKYRASIRVVDEVRKDRVVSRVYADSPYAQSVESSQRVLGTAIDAARN